MRITLTRLAGLDVGDFICEVDNDELLTDAEINEWYNAQDQDWMEVLGFQGHSDITRLRVRYSDGTEGKSPTLSYDSTVWKKVNDE